MSPFSLNRYAVNVRRTGLLFGLLGLIGVTAWFCVTRTTASSDYHKAALQPPDSATIARNYGELPLSFERNDGQFDAEAKFISRGAGYELFLTRTGAVLSLRQAESRGTDGAATSRPPASVLNLQMLNASPNVTIEGQDELEGKANYFVRNDPAIWRTNVPTFRRVQYTGIFPGIDVVYYGNRTQLEYDFILAPHANPSAIKFAIDGADRITIGD
ncbi:MAG TPA: hypothetical protein VHP99_14040, partial [Pyrinomonadaceae bacterium]|nr:hypothetical protein [Pyrinomonadaceae bacterium]